LSRLGIADAIDAGIRVTPPYGKSATAGQMQPCDAAMHAITSLWKGEVIQSQQCRGKKTSDYFAAAPGNGGRGCQGGDLHHGAPQREWKAGTEGRNRRAAMMNRG
jgi:hypothetical protein